jgi:hypothetical protein
MEQLKLEIQAITGMVRKLRQQQALNVVKQAEQQLIKTQLNARNLKLPVAVLGTGQCKHQKQPYSVLKPKPRTPSSGKPQKPV